MRAWLSRLAGLFHRGDRDLNAELASHIQLHIDDNLRAGMAPAEARRAALLKFGGLEPAKEAYRDRSTLPQVEAVVRDVRYGLRTWRKAPGFAAIAVAILALAIGANAAIFSVTNAVFWAQLPVEKPAELQFVGWDGAWPGGMTQSGNGGELTWSIFQQIQSQTDVFDSVFGYAGLGFLPNVSARSAGGQTSLVDAMMVTGQFFSGLHVTPVIGRGLIEDDERNDRAPAVVLGYRYWRRAFDGDPNILGATVILNGIPANVVGVAPPEFFGMVRGRQIDVWMPVEDMPTLRPYSLPVSFNRDGLHAFTSPNWFWLRIAGRLKPGVTIERARAECDVIFQRSVENAKTPGSTDTCAPAHIEITSASQGEMSLTKSATPLMLLQAMVGVVLLIACANLAALLLERGTARRAEMSLRLALGAGRGRLIQQLLVEGTLLAVAGAGLGLVLANWGSRGLVVVLSGGSDTLALDVHVDWIVLGFVAALTICTTVFFGLAPALSASKADVISHLKDSTRGATGRRTWGRSALVSAQIALSLTLLTGAGLFIRSLANLHREELGFSREGVLLFGVDPRQSGYEQPRVLDFYRTMLERLRSIPDVRAASLSDLTLIGRWVNQSSLSTDDGQSTSKKTPSSYNVEVGPDFVTTMGIPVRLGRELAASDVTKSTARVAVINESMAALLWPGRSPLGRRLSFGEPYHPETAFEIVGVVQDAKLGNVREPMHPTMYFPYVWSRYPIGRMNFEVRTSGDAASIVPAVRAAVRAADPNLALMDVKTEADQIDQTLLWDRVLAGLSAAFGVLSLLLAGIGLYGLLAYQVRQRAREMGIRLALGAQGRDILQLVVVRGLMLTLIGVAAGLAGALVAVRTIANSLFGVQSSDPRTLLGVAALLVLTAIAACLIPARRAMRIDPIGALRDE